jgi:Uma2 family endonuclease
MTPQEFDAWEDEQPVRHEYYYGEIFALDADPSEPEAMAGGSVAHSLITSNASFALKSALRGGPCRVFSPDLRVARDAAGHYGYPDVTVVCGAVAILPGTQIVTNPTLVVEVLSPSTEVWDRGGKLDAYRRMPTVQTVVLVGSTGRSVEVFTRDGDGWRLATPGAEGRVALGAVAATLSLDDLYDGVDLPERPPHPWSGHVREPAGAWVAA